MTHKYSYTSRGNHIFARAARRSWPARAPRCRRPLRLLLAEELLEARGSVLQLRLNLLNAGIQMQCLAYPILL